MGNNVPPLIQNKYYTEEARKIPVRDHVDVLVVGGGPAGIGAAISAGRMGAKTMILERYGFLGGCSTISGVNTICGLFRSHSTNPIPIIKGVAWEIVEALRKRGAASDPCPTGKTFLVIFDDQVLKEVADELMQTSKVSILYHALATNVIMDGDVIKGAIIETKSGREVVYAKSIVDATGDGDIAALSHNAYQKGTGATLQPPTLMFKIGNVKLDKISSLSRSDLEKLMTRICKKGEFVLPRISGSIRIIPGRKEVLCNMTRITSAKGYIDGTDSNDLTYAEIEGRRQIRLYTQFLKQYVAGFEDSYVSNSGPQIGIRETRLIQGEYILSENDILTGRKFDDAVLRSSWPLEIHGVGKSTEWHWIEGGEYYEIPLRCLIPNKIDNLLIAGRCISTTHQAQASTRVSACCYGTGQAAGILASLAIEEKSRPREINHENVKKLLRIQGCLV